MTYARSLLVLLLLSLLAGCGGSGLRTASTTESPLALQRVVLYRNGVAYFERHGKVRGDRLWLKVRKDQINDLLKSLAVVDRGSGHVVSVSIPLDPRSWQKAALAALRPGHGNLAQVLDALRGSLVRVDAGRRSVRGRIVMVEEMQPSGVPAREHGPDVEFRDHKLSLLDGEELHVVRLSDIHAIELQDGDVAMQIHRHLDASAGEGMFQQVELSIALAGQGEHDLALSYVAPAPQWKPTYRIVMDEAQPGVALLQAWAVVDNVSGENWDGVQLSLTAGEPLAFRYDLHTPREVERPDLSRSGVDRRARVALGERSFADDDEVAAAPEMASEPGEDAMMEMEEIEATGSRVARQRRSKRGRGGGTASGAAAQAMPAPAPPPMDMKDMQTSTAAQARAARVSGLTRFDLQTPVSLPDGSATMVALINQRVKGEQVFLYKPGGSGQGYEHNPYRVVRFHNDTDFALEPGPISIYSGGSFVGEGLSEAVGSRETATIPFAVEPSVTVRSTVVGSGEKMRIVKLVRGVLEVESFRRVTTEWMVQSDGSQAAQVLVRHPRQGRNYVLVDPPPGVEELPDAYFVPVKLARGTRKASVKVIEQTPTRTSISIWDGRAVALLDTLLSTGELDAAQRAQLEPVVKKRREIGRIDTEVASLERQKEELNERAAETRKSLKAIQKDPKAGALRRKLSTRLETFTRDADSVGRRIVELQTRRLELKVELEDLLEALGTQDVGGAKTK